MSYLIEGWLLDLGFKSGIRTQYIDAKGLILELEFNKQVIQLSHAITNQMTKSFFQLSHANKDRVSIDTID